MIVVGLTGLIGSGKSTVLDFFKKYGAETFSCDEYVRQLNSCEDIINEVAKHFPNVIVDKKIDIILLKKDIFKDYENNIKILEEIYHPYVIEKIKSIIKNNRFCFWKILVLEVPLLFEASIDKFCKYTIIVNCDEETRIARVKKRSFIEDEELKKIIIKQGSIDHKLPLVDFVIDTNDDFYSIENNVKNFMDKIKFGSALFKIN